MATQYNIRIGDISSMDWEEFENLLIGLMPDTPLGNIVAIRSETDPANIKSFNDSQRRIRYEWNLKMAKKQLNNTSKLDASMDNLSKMLKTAFGVKEVQKCPQTQ